VLAQLGPVARQELLQLLGVGGFGSGSLEQPSPPSRRRPRRGDVVTYRVRVDVSGTKPPLWRRLELASDLFLDELHEILQVAFGWTDSHLHRFMSGPRPYGPEAEYYLGPLEAADGEAGVAEDEVRLDELLADPGDLLFYVYDYGDDWQHTIKLEAVLPRGDDAPRAVCTAGRRDGPPEDCGGVYGYELICGAMDLDHPEHDALVDDFVRFFGDDADPGLLDTTSFDREEINDAFAELGFDDAPSQAAADVPAPLAELVEAVGTAPARRRLRHMLAEAHLEESVTVDADVATRMMRPYAWLLERVGEEGITLTGAGYLPPVHVEAAVDELGLAEEWIGKGNREVQTLPVLHLRQSAQRFRLVRKHRGRLLPTTRGRALRTDPVGLWWHVAERMPPRSTDACEAQAGLVLLVAVAAQVGESWDGLVADLLDAIGWTSSDGAPLTAAMAYRAAWDTAAVLRRVGAFTAERLTRAGERPTPEGVAFARAALRTWPDSDLGG
jgi:hypothetical protein